MLKLSHILPEFARELANGLVSIGHDELASVVKDLEIAHRCPCQETGCLTFYAVPKSEALRPEDCQQIVPSVQGVSCVHHQDGRIVWVEAIGRPQDRRTLDEAMPITDAV